MGKHIKLIISCSTLFLLLGIQLKAQNKLANKLYNNFGYKTSINAYELKGDLKEDEIIKIADSYRLVNDTENAVKWYGQLVKTSSDPIHSFYYAQMLQSNGKYQEAKTYYLKYDALNGGNDQRGLLLAAAIDRMNDLQRSNIEITNETGINTDKLEFSPTYYNGGIVFVSNQAAPKGINPDRTDAWTGEKYTALFFAKKNINGQLESVEEFAYDLTTRYHEGPVSFSRNGAQIYFTRNSFKNGRKNKSSDGILKLDIFTATKTSLGWEDITTLPFCSPENNESHPSLSSDGQTLFFASDREGGYGGMDLYMSVYQNDSWSEPINLGNKINTAGNEVFPFMHDDGTLYFASNGLGGLGGADIFSSKMINDAEWMDATNIGAPFNSNKDDFGFILNVLGTEGYFNSSRPGGSGQDDIYSFTMSPESIQKANIVTINASVCTFDQGTDARLSGVKISVLERVRDGSVVDIEKDYVVNLVPTQQEGEFTLNLKKRDGSNATKFITDKNGEIEYKMLPNKEYVFIAEKDGYRTAEKVFSTENMTKPENVNFCLPLVQSSCMTISGAIKNMFHENRIPNASITLINHCTGREEMAQSNLLGEFTFSCVDCSCDFTITANKENFHEASSYMEIGKINCQDGKTQNFILELASVYDARSKNPPTSNNNNGNNGYPDSNGSTNNGGNNNSGNDYYPNNGSSNPNTIAEGNIIEVDNIYYDFNDATLRPQGQQSLDEIAGLMRTYPSMKIELSAHTDSRGHWKYNTSLSKRRAEQVVLYLINQGIDETRLKARGYGESQLKNQCDEGVTCTEEEHQYNRRTEIKITKFDRQDISIRYVDRDSHRG